MRYECCAVLDNVPSSLEEYVKDAEGERVTEAIKLLKDDGRVLHSRGVGPRSPEFRYWQLTELT